MNEITKMQNTTTDELDPRTIVQVSINNLIPHPDAAAYGDGRDPEAEQEDRVALEDDIRRVGILEPLSIAPRDGDGFWVLDGCGRLEAARNLDMQTVPCILAPEGALADVAAYAVSRNAMRRRLSTGERALRWVMQRKHAVVEAYIEGQKQALGQGNMGGSHTPCSRDNGVSARSIAERLGCSPMDALAAVQLVVCLEKGWVPRLDNSNGRLALEKSDDAYELAMVQEAARGVLSGRTPIRRWAAAYAGKAATKNQKKTEADYQKIFTDGLGRMRRSAEHWNDFKANFKEAAIAQFTAMIRKLPPDLAACITKVVREKEEVRGR